MERQLGTLIIREGEWVGTKTWQALDVSDREEMIPLELLNVTTEVPIPESVALTQALIKPNLPWAEDHFLERVSGVPHNPPPSHVNWPHARKGNEKHRVDGKFSHTYPERFWPKWANGGRHERYGGDSPNIGLRYYLGDLGDLVGLLRKDLHTRQAFLPVFFPEDTGATHGQRIPCTLGYHFMVRQGKMHIVYYIRSCDFLRHFKDDVYMAMRLAQWVRDQIEIEKLEIAMGDLTMHVASMHVFRGDLRLMRKRYL